MPILSLEIAAKSNWWYALLVVLMVTKRVLCSCAYVYVYTHAYIFYPHIFLDIFIFLMSTSYVLLWKLLPFNKIYSPTSFLVGAA